MVFVYIIIFYIFFVSVILRFIVPNLGFIKKSIPQTAPSEIERVISRAAKVDSQMEALQVVYNYITQRFTGSRIKTITKFWRAFGDVFTKKPGFLPCTGQNYLLRAMLVKSGAFKEEDIIVKTVPLNFFIHQYLEVRVDGEILYVDPWSHFLGKPVGARSFFFG